MLYAGPLCFIADCRSVPNYHLIHIPNLSLVIALNVAYNPEPEFHLELMLTITVTKYTKTAVTTQMIIKFI